MNILQRIFNGTSKAVAQIPFSASILQRFAMRNSTGALTTKNYVNEYRNWVYACVQSRSEEIGNIKLRLFDGDKEVHKHELLDLLNSVNPYMTKHELFEATQAFKDLQGNAFWYLARDGGDGKIGKIREIYVLKPDAMRIVPSTANPLQVSEYIFKQPDGQTIRFSKEQILHHKNFDPRANHPFPYIGMGIVEAAAYPIDTDNEARVWNLNFFRNGARPDGVLIADGEAASDPDQQQRIREEFAEEYQGSANAHKLAVLTGGIKYQELTRNQKDMDFYNGRIFSRDEILSLFKVPKSIIGITDDVNRANAEASVYVFALHTIKPLMQKLIDTLNETIVKEYGDNLRLDFHSPVPEDRVSKTAEYTAGFNIWLSRNDIRRMEGLPETENGDVIYGQFGEEEQDRTPKPTKTASTEAPTHKTDTKQETKSIGEEVVAKFAAKLPVSNFKKNETRKGIDQEIKSELIDSWNKRGESNTKVLSRKVRNYFAVQEKEVQENLARELKGLKSPEYKYKGIEDMLFDAEKSVASAISLITPFIRQYIKESGKIGNDAARGDGFKDDTERISKFAEDRSKYFANTINETTRTELFETIEDGISNQESLDDISKRIAEVYKKAQDYRTDMIARTEVAASSNFGTVEGYKQAGVSEHQWIVVNPEDDDCLVNDGEIVAIGSAFPSGDTVAPIHPNCMCTTIPVFKD
jgi:HK97 family phage portal protein